MPLLYHPVSKIIVYVLIQNLEHQWWVYQASGEVRLEPTYCTFGFLNFEKLNYIILISDKTIQLYHFYANNTVILILFLD